MIKLKPCPFCGEQPIMVPYGNAGCVIRCDNPDCHVDVVICSWDENAVQDAWNTRAGEPERIAHWDINCDGYYLFCSNCGESVANMSLYCPYCGCHMVTRGEEE